jgi:hypothetical protein
VTPPVLYPKTYLLHSALICVNVLQVVRGWGNGGTLKYCCGLWVNLLGSDVDHHSDPSPVGQYGVGGICHTPVQQGGIMVLVLTQLLSWPLPFSAIRGARLEVSNHLCVTRFRLFLGCGITAFGEPHWQIRCCAVL